MNLTPGSKIIIDIKQRTINTFLPDAPPVVTDPVITTDLGYKSGFFYVTADKGSYTYVSDTPQSLKPGDGLVIEGIGTRGARPHVISVNGRDIVTDTPAPSTYRNATAYFNNADVIYRLTEKKVKDYGFDKLVGRYAIGSDVVGNDVTGLRMVGPGNDKLVFFSPKGCPGAKFEFRGLSSFEISDFSLEANGNDNNFSIGWNSQIGVGNAYYDRGGIKIFNSKSGYVRRVKVKDLVTYSHMMEACEDVHFENNITDLQYPQPGYVGWHHLITASKNCTSVGHLFTSKYQVHGYECFNTDNCVIDKAKGINSLHSLNTCRNSGFRNYEWTGTEESWNPAIGTSPIFEINSNLTAQGSPSLRSDGCFYENVYAEQVANTGISGDRKIKNHSIFFWGRRWVKNLRMQDVTFKRPDAMKGAVGQAFMNVEPINLNLTRVKTIGEMEPGFIAQNMGYWGGGHLNMIYSEDAPFETLPKSATLTDCTIPTIRKNIPDASVTMDALTKQRIKLQYQG